MMVNTKDLGEAISNLHVSHLNQLVDAINSDNEEKVQYLLEVEKVDPNQSVNDSNQTVLTIACQNQKLQIVRLLVKNETFPADPNKLDQDEVTPFFHAVRTGNLDILKILLTECQVKVNVNYRVLKFWGLRIWNPLIYAIRHNNVPLADMMLKFGADPNGCDGDFVSPLGAAIVQRNVEMCNMLLDNGCNTDKAYCPNHPDVFSAIETAAMCCRIDIMELLKDKLNQVPFLTDFNTVALSAIFIVDDATVINYCLEEQYKQMGPQMQSNETILNAAIVSNAEAGFRVLLRWGVLASQCASSNPGPSIKFDEIYESKFHGAANQGNVNMLKLLAEFSPQCLQDRWLVEGDIPTTLDGSFAATLIEVRKQATRLDVLCRAKIIEHLGYKPLEKVHQLLFPRILKDFLLFKNTEGFM